MSDINGYLVEAKSIVITSLEWARWKNYLFDEKQKNTRLTEQLAESQRQNRELRDLCMEVYSDHKAPDMPIGYNECEKDKCDWCARLDRALHNA